MASADLRLQDPNQDRVRELEENVVKWKTMTEEKEEELQKLLSAKEEEMRKKEEEIKAAHDQIARLTARLEALPRQEEGARGEEANENRPLPSEENQNLPYWQPWRRASFFGPGGILLGAVFVGIGYVFGGIHETYADWLCAAFFIAGLVVVLPSTAFTSHVLTLPSTFQPPQRLAGQDQEPGTTA